VPPDPGRAARWLDRALRIVDAGPRPFCQAATVSLAVTSAVAVAVAALIRPAGPLPWAQREIIGGALIALELSVLLGLAQLATAGRTWPAAWLDRVIAPRERAVIWLALAAWFPFLLVVVYYRAKATLPPPVQYVYSTYDDKRWLTAAYLLGVLAPVGWLTAAARVLAVGRDRPLSWRAWFAGLFPRAGVGGRTARAGRCAVGGASGAVERRPGGARRLLLVVAGVATALALAWYFLGPFWYISQASAPISRQEDVWLVGLQAIAKGQLPYLGAAEVPYGPGTQVVTYLLMHHVTSFSVIGFRQAWALQVWAAASAAFVVFFLAFGYVRGLAASLLSALAYPGLHMLAFQPSTPFAGTGSSYNGYFGWADPMRYVGMIALVLLLPAVARRCPSRGGVVAGTVLGAFWGLTSYLAQENLAGGAVGALAVGVLLLLGGFASWHAVWTALAATLAGFALVWAPVLAYYNAHGQLGEFLSLYFLFPRAVAEGINDTPWQGFQHEYSSLTPMYYTLPFLLAVLALLSAFQVRPVRIATEWSRERVLLFATLVATILLYQGVLLRSDASHLTGTLLMVPALVIITGTVLPRIWGAQRRVTAAVAGAALVVASFALLPSQAYAWTTLRSWAEAPYLDRQQLAAAPAAARDTLVDPPAAAQDILADPPAAARDTVAGPPAPAQDTLAGQRVGAGVSGAAQCCQGAPESMSAFIQLMERIHVIVGDRTAYVADFHGASPPGLVYFAADLTPPQDVLQAYDGSTLTEAGLTAYLAEFRTKLLPEIQAFLTYNVKGPEAEAFLHRYPNARLYRLRYANHPYYLYLR
jgi:hypothetical protein